MNVVTRGVRNAFRNGIRTTSIVVILGLSIGLALSMLIARAGVENKINTIKSSTGTAITISPAGARGFQGGGEPLTEDQINKVKSIDHVASVSGTLQDRLSNDNTNLQSAIDPGTLGRRFSGNGGGDRPMAFGDGSGSATFSLPVTVTGTDNPTSTSNIGGGTFKVASGTVYASGSSDYVAVIGKAVATKNNLSVGSTFTAYGKDIKVVAIYDAGNEFANASVLMPLNTLQTLSSQTGDLTSATVQADSSDNVTGVTNAIKTQLGDAADVTSQEDVISQTIEPLKNIKNVALFSLVGSVVAGSVIILLTMVMIVRERRREIGVLKAIGASNLKVMFQFMAEAVTFTLLAAVVGIIIGIAGAKPVTSMLVNNASSSSSTVAQGPGGVGTSTGMQRFQRPAGGGFNRAFNRVSGANLHDIKTAVGISTVVYGLGAAIVIALVGSAVPALFISKVKPAEVMRVE